MYEKYLVLALFIQFLFPFVVMIKMFKRRVGAVRSKQVALNYFKSHQGEHDLPEHVAVYGRHYVNLFEMPILFMIGGVLSLVLNQIDLFLLVLAYSFVLVRLVHSIIHLGSNNLFHRLKTFTLSCLVLLIFWTYLVGKIFLM